MTWTCITSINLIYHNRPVLLGSILPPLCSVLFLPVERLSEQCLDVCRALFLQITKRQETCWRQPRVPPPASSCRRRRRWRWRRWERRGSRSSRSASRYRSPSRGTRSHPWREISNTMIKELYFGCCLPGHGFILCPRGDKDDSDSERGEHTVEDGHGLLQLVDDLQKSCKFIQAPNLQLF